MQRLVFLAASSLALTSCSGCPGAADPSSASSEEARGAADTEAETAPSPAPSAEPAETGSARPAATEAGAPAVREASPLEATRLLQTLRALVREGATEDDFPWALAHGLLAFGPKLETSEGRSAVDVIAGHARSESIGGKSVYRFPEETDAGLPVEPHEDMILRTFVSAEVPLDRTLALADGKKLPLRRLVEDAEWAFALPVTEAGWERFPWSAGLFYSTHGPMEQIQTQSGPLALHVVAARGLQALEQSQDFIAELMDEDRPGDLRKRRQKIYAHSCGGLHFLQAGLHGAAHQGQDALLARARRQLDVLAFRWEAERGLYRKTLAANPEYAPLLLVQELKFFGHALETFALAAKWGFELTPADARFFRWVTADLARAVEQLKPIYAAQDSLRESSEQTYNDLIGDGCHAIRGLELGRELFFGAGEPEDAKP